MLLRKRIPLERRHVKNDRLLAHIPKGWKAVALDERGDSLRSLAFAKKIENYERGGTPGLVFFVGDADGLSNSIKERCDWSVSLSPLTLPHQLCFVLLAEQLYRATSIIKGEPYHRE